MKPRWWQRPTCLVVLGIGLVPGVSAHAAGEAAGRPEFTDAVRGMLEELSPQAGQPFSTAAGHRTWHRVEANGRSCTSCHGETTTVGGRHEKTGKPIEPMARSVNPERLTERKKMAKWFLRNCKWTFGRECTAQEKGDILMWLSGQ